MKTPIEEMLNYKILALIVLAIFYGIYFAKMIVQKRHGDNNAPDRPQEGKGTAYG